MKYKALSLLAEIQTGPFGSQLHKHDYVEVGTPIVTVEHLGNREFSEQNLPKVSDEDKEKLNKYTLKTGDVVFSRVGSVDRCSYVSKKYEGWLFSGRCLRVRANEEILPLFLYYYFCLDRIKNLIKGIAVGATMPSINTRLLGELCITYPDIATQERIANILSCIDDKIAINKAINKNLEATAQAIFQELLSNEYDMCLISDFIVINPSRKLRKGELARYIDMKQLSTSSCCPIGYSKKEFDGGARFINGDTLLARITPCFENGKAAYIDCLNDDEVAFGSTEYIVLSPKIGVPSEFAYCLVRYDEFREYAKKNMNGSSGRQRISTDALENYEIPAIKLDKLKSFGVVAHSLFNQIRNVFFENQRLAAIRDALLSKLMSGEIDVSQVKI